MQKTATKLFYIFLGFVFFFSSQCLWAQEEGQVSLLSYVQTLEQRYDVRFSYVTDEIKVIYVTPLSEETSLEECIVSLNRTTPFQVSKINDRYYSISKRNMESSGLCGKLLDGISGLPLENASIIVDGELYGTVTDEKGIFYVPNQFHSENLTIRYIGYETLTLEVSELNESCPELFVFPSVSRLNEVLISSFLIKGINRNANGSTSLNTNNFGLLPGQTENDVLQIAQALPGVESVNETISTINIRGGTNDENLILWEGIRMYQIGHFFGLISAFNPNLTQELTIYKNGTPSNYGESVSGVIAMGSNNTIAKKIHGGVGSNLINTNAFLEIPVSESFGIQISGRTSINGLFKTPVYNNFSNRVFQDTEITNNQNSEDFTDVKFKQDFYFFDVGGKFLWDMTEKDKLRLNLIAMENHFEFSEILSGSEETSRLEQKSEAAGISWLRDWSSNFSSEISLQATHYLLDALNRDIFTFQEINQENEVLDLGAKLDTETRFSEVLQLQSGYHFAEVGVSNLQDVNLPRFRDYEKDVLRSHIVYGNLVYRSPSKSTRLDVGARANYFEKFSKFLLEPRFHWYQGISKGWALEIAGEMKSQNLTQRIDLQSDFLGIEKRRWVLANDASIPTKMSQQASVGILYNRKGWFFNVEGFYKKVEGITSKSQGFQNQYQFSTEIGNYRTVGVEVTVNKKFKNFSAWVSYGLGKNDYEFKNFDPAEFPNNIDIRHTVSLASSYHYKNFKLALGLNWRTGKPYTVPVSDTPSETGDGFYEIDYGTPNNERLSDYFRADVSGEYLWNISEKVSAKFNLALLNVTNQNNTLNIRYALEDATNASSDINRIEEASLGFTPNFSVQVLF